MTHPSSSSAGDDRKKWKIAAAGVGVLAVAIGYWALVLRPDPNSPDVPGGTFWLCKPNGHTFHLTISQLSDYHRDHYGEPVPCPKCKSTETVRANKCAKCGEHYPQARGVQPPCPKCGAPFEEPKT